MKRRGVAITALRGCGGDQPVPVSATINMPYAVAAPSHQLA
jgi:hypothetical protein